MHIQSRVFVTAWAKQAGTMGNMISGATYFNKMHSLHLVLLSFLFLLAI
jgi:hypothetical protein